MQWDPERGNGGSIAGLSIFGAEAYGAKVDGSTDDYGAINSALQAAKSAGGGIVAIPAGVCRFSQKILVPDGVLLRGAGMVIVGSSTKGTILRPKGISADVAIQPEKIDSTQESFQISDLCLDLSSNATGLGTLTDCGIDVRGVFNDSFLRNVVVYGNANMSVPGIRYAPATATDGCGAVYSANVHVVPTGNQTGILVTDNVTGTEVNGVQSCTWIGCTVEGSGSADSWLFETSYAANRIFGMLLLNCRGRANAGAVTGNGIPLHIKGGTGIYAVDFYGQMTGGGSPPYYGVVIEHDANSNNPSSHAILNFLNAGGVTAFVHDIVNGFAAATASGTYVMPANDTMLGTLYLPGTGAALKNLSTKSMVMANAALATNATGGFVYLPTSAGTPSGTPGTQTGTVATEYDTSHDVLEVYNGSWRQVNAELANVMTSELDLQGDGSENTLASFSVPAGSCKVGTAFEFAGSFVASNSTGGALNVTLEFKLGSVVVATLAIAIANGASSRSCAFRGIATCRSIGSSGSFVANGSAVQGNGTGSAAAQATAQTVDTTAAQTLAVTATLDSTGTPANFTAHMLEAMAKRTVVS